VAINIKATLHIEATLHDYSLPDKCICHKINGN